MASKAVYARFGAEIHEKVKAHAETTGQSLSSAIEDLVQRGLGELFTEGDSEALNVEIASLKERIPELESKFASADGERRALKGQLEGLEAKAAIALAAQKHAQTLEQQVATQTSQMDQVLKYLYAPVGTCKKCKAYMRLYDIGQQRCPSCSTWPGFDWLPAYQPPSTIGETLRDGAAMVGAAAIVIALLNALNGGRGKT